MCVNDRKAGGKVKLEEFKYVSAIQSNEQCTREVKRVQGVERVEMSVGGSETCYDVWLGDCGTDKKTGGRAEMKLLICLLQMSNRGAA